MTQETFRELLLAGLDRSAELRARVVEDAAFSERRTRLRAWQAARLAASRCEIRPSSAGAKAPTPACAVHQRSRAPPLSRSSSTGSAALRAARLRWGCS